MHLPQLVWLGAVALLLLGFVDAPFRTFGQKFVTQKSRERLVLLSFEFDLLALWAVGHFYMHWDRRFVPAAWVPASTWLGVVVTLVGVGLSVWAKFRLGRWFSATFAVKEGHELITDGPYAFTRHPIYTGLLIALLGTALVWKSVLTLALVPLFTLGFFFHTVYEEVLFERHFGDAYRDYETRVPRLIPFWRPKPRT